MSRPVADAVRLEPQSDYGYSLGTVEWAGATGSIEGGEANTDQVELVQGCHINSDSPVRVARGPTG